MNKIPVGVLGASGYAGRELCALVHNHPSLELLFATANDQRGTTARLRGRDVTFVATEDAPLQRAQLIFSALPHGTSREWVMRARDAGARAVDLSHDLRPGNGCDHAPYGLTEIMRAAIAGAELVSNPGCYPTSVLLPLAPLIADDLIAPGATIIVNSSSGVTGAGNSPKRELLFAEVGEDYRAYGVGNTHRHLHEMRAVSTALGTDAEIIFTPHLLPVARGILSTITVPLRRELADVLAPWRRAYGGEPFIQLSDTPPTLREVAHRNIACISATPVLGVRHPMLVVICAIDNLMKGAAGQAVQNANLMLGLAEQAGLPA